MAAAMPAQQAQPSFLQAVRAFCKLIYQTKTADEAKVATYLFEHTICYQEFDRAKRVTLDEFANGRKRKDRSRLDDGCGVKSRSHVSEALTRLKDRHLVTVLSDEQDRARIRKSYALNLDCSGKRNTGEELTPIIDLPVQSVPESGTQRSVDRNTEVRKAEHSVPASGTRSEYVPLVGDSKEETKESTPTLALSARGSDSEPQGIEESADLKEKRRELHDLEAKIRKMEKAGLVGPYLRKLNDQAREIRQLLADATPIDSSHSQETDNAPTLEQPEVIEEDPRAALYETETSEHEEAPEIACEDETPAQDSADESSNEALFPEALLPEKEDWYGTVGGWFYDMEHVDARDKQTIMVAIARIKARGYTVLWEVESRFWKWRKKYADLQRAGIMHFANNLQRV